MITHRLTFSLLSRRKRRHRLTLTNVETPTTMTQQNLFQEIQDKKPPTNETIVSKRFEDPKKFENPFGIDRIIHGKISK